ncbi:succinate dehydrogenase assembly factor 2 [Palleronia caenipelagi]|uniref:FAD assembly factor SdhE n=2 Tax=Palleronia caenipelagi TaxID=2489174 RepID=A0A547Q9Q5_9RHOB|nr:succinate dehydrogenase assembly factor 2 [Palleronia caenipelagi]TRD23127.1 succinate dehydrogenase assembly factor 2 [Palleronia caenipelagi]
MLRKLGLRSIRRGIKEMDIILGGYAEARLAEMDDEGLALYERFMFENDQDLYRWVSGQDAAPTEYSALVADISAFAVAHAAQAREARG